MFVQECISELATGQPDLTGWVLTQVDVRNAFNSLDRGPMLRQTAARAPPPPHAMGG